MEKQQHKKTMWLYQLLMLLISLSIPFLLFGQSIDSLERELTKKNHTIDEKIKLYDDLSWLYNRVDVKRSIYFGEKGLALAQKNGNKKMEVIFCKNISLAYYMGGILDTAIIYLKKAQPIADKLGEYRLQASLHSAYGNIYLNQGEYDLALENYFAAAKIYNKHNDIKKLAIPYNNIGGVYQLMKNYEQALKYFEITEKLSIQTNDQEGLAGTYVSLSDISLNQKKPKEVSVDYAKKAVEIFKKLGNKFALNNALLTLAKVYSHHKDYIASETIARQALAQAKEIGAKNLIAKALMILSNTHIHQGQYAQSIEMAKEVLVTDSTDKNIMKNVYSNLALSNAYIGRPALAEQHLKNYREVLDHYANESYQKSVSALDVKYETEKKQLKIQVLEKQRQLYTWLGIAGGMILLIALAFAIIRYRLAVSKRKIAEQETKRMKQEKQLVAIQATLDGESAERTRLAKDLHDGLGSMLSVVKFNLPQMKGGAILETADVSRFQKAIGMLDESIHELRRVAHHMMPETLLRHGLRASLKDFCEAIVMVNFHYFGNETRLPEKFEIMVYRCIHELVNNAMKHAEATQINVQLVQEEDSLSFTVQDDGKGFDQDNVSEGMGLGNIRQRVEAYQGKINIYSSGQGTEVHVELEITKNNLE